VEGEELIQVDKLQEVLRNRLLFAREGAATAAAVDG
jgi:hypothetical protein